MQRRFTLMRGFMPTLVLGFLLTLCAAADAAVTVYNVALPGIPNPGGSTDRSTSYLIININRIAGESVTVNKTTNTGSSTAAAKTTGSTSAAIDPSTDPCLTKPVQLAACQAKVHALLGDTTTRLGQYQATGSDKTSLDTHVGGEVEADFTRHTDVTKVEAATDLQSAVQVYAAQVSTTTTFYDVLQELKPLLPNSLLSDTENWNASYGSYLAANKTLNDSTIAGDLASIQANLKSLSNASITTMATEAATLYNEVAGWQDDPSPLYAVVSAPCQAAGYNSNSYKIVYTGAPATKSWEQDISCFAEFSTGAMYYVSSLSTATYTLNAQNIPVKHNGNVDQGSVAALFNWCPGEGGNVPCATISISSDTNGLTGFIGGAYLFAHRVLGVNFGARLGQVNVLTNGYSTTQTTAVPSGATYTQKQLEVGGYVGLTLNLGKQ